MRVFPFGQRRGTRFGRCRLCGRDAQLSKTHVPANRAGNWGETRRAVTRVDEDGLSTLGLGRANEGGLWDFWFCIDCNSRTGAWDQEYIRVQKPLVLMLHDNPDHARERLVGTLPQIDIGALVRAIWAWSFALLPTLIDCLPDLAEAVRTGDAIQPPDDLQLLLALTMDLRVWVSGQPDAWLVEVDKVGMHRRPSGLVVPGPRVERLPVTVVASPPFSAVLGHADRPADVPHVRVNDWLRDPAGSRRDVAIDLPMIDVVDEEVMAPVSYARFRPAASKPEGRWNTTGHKLGG